MKESTWIPTKKAAGKKTMNKKGSKVALVAKRNDKSKVSIKYSRIRVIMPKNTKGSDDDF